MATMQFTDADRDERGFIRVGTVPPERRRGLADFLPTAAPAEAPAPPPSPTGRPRLRLDPQHASTFALVTAGMVLAAVLLTLLNGLPPVAAPPARLPAAPVPPAPVATGAPTAAADPVVARVYHAPDGAEAGALRQSVVAAGFDVVGRCGASAWLRVRPRVADERWEAWVRAADVRLDPAAATDVVDLCAPPPAPAAPARSAPAAPDVEAAPPPAPVVEAAPPAAPPPAAAPPAVTPVVVQIQRPSGEVVRLEAQIPAPDPNTAHIPTAVVAAPPPQPDRVIPNPGSAATAIARCGAACIAQPTPSP